MSSRPGAPPSHALGPTAPLAAAVELPLLGVPARFRSNSPAVIAAVERALGRWRDLPAGLIAAGPPVRVDIVVQPRGPDEPPAAPGDHVAARAHGDTFLAAGGGRVMTAALARGEALAFVTPELAADEPRLRHGVIERLGLLLAGRRDRAPVGAAAVVRKGTAVLLAGPSGTGKSSLCYACVRAGFALLAEDTVHVSLERGLRVWGHGGPIHLRADAPLLFPELAALGPAAPVGGGLRIAVDPAAPGAGGAVTHADRAVVCVLELVAGQASRLEPLPAAVAAAALADPEAPGHDPGRGAAVAAALTAGGAYRLSVGSDLGSAVLLLEHLAEP